MKAAFIHEQLEYRLEVAKDGIRQGDLLPCTLLIKNHDAASKTISDLRFELAYGETKAIKEKKPDAFETVASATLALPIELAPGQQHSITWGCQLDRNCAISEKSKGLYFLYGRSSGQLGQQPISVQAHADTEAILRIFETSFQFVLKGQRSSKGWFYAKLKPPTSKRFSMLTELGLGFHFENGGLALCYNFNEKRFESSRMTTGVNSKKTAVDRHIAETSYLLSGGFINQEAVEAEINQALKVAAFEL